MAKIISFAWTSPALIAGRKTVTRRNWTHDYARKFRKGDEVIAYNKSPRNGGRPIARLRLTHDPVYEDTQKAPDSDYEAEGFRYFEEHPEQMTVPVPIGREAYDRWRRSSGWEWVIRFEVIEVL